MRKAKWLAVTALLLASLLLFAGCGGASKSSSNANSNTSSTESSGAEEGVPIYPGATRVDASQMMPGPGPGGPGTQGSQPTAPESTNGSPGVDPRSSATTPAPANGQVPPPQGTESGPASSGMRALSVAYRTADSVDKVVAWYIEQLSGKTGFQQVAMPSRGGTSGQTTDEGTALSFKSGDTTKMVMIRQDTSNETGGTLIMISNAPEGMPSAPPSNQE